MAATLQSSSNPPIFPGDGYTPQRAEHAWLHRPTLHSTFGDTELVQLPAPDYGTVYHHISEMRTYCTVGTIIIKDIFV